MSLDLLVQQARTQATRIDNARHMSRSRHSRPVSIVRQNPFYSSVAGDNSVAVKGGLWFVEGRHREKIPDQTVVTNTTGYVFFRADRADEANWEFVNDASPPNPTSGSYFEIDICEVTVDGTSVTITDRTNPRRLYGSAM